MNYIPYTVTKGVATKEIPCITGKGAPSTATVGAVGLFYMDEDNGAVYKCVAADAVNGVYTWEPVASMDTLYYPTLSIAINDINDGVTTNALTGVGNACVKVFTAETGRLTVSLLADVSESTLITVSKDIDLVLAGHTLSFTTVDARLSFAEGTSCTINGEVAGSKIIKTWAAPVGSNTRAIEASGDRLTVRGGEYECNVTIPVDEANTVSVVAAIATSKNLELFDCYLLMKCSGLATTRGAQVGAGKLVLVNSKIHVEGDTGNVFAVASGGSGEVSIDNCEIKAVISADGSSEYAVGVVAMSNVASIKDSTIIADAPGSDANDEHSKGIWVYPATTCYVTNTNIYATHSGISNRGSLYVLGGILSGWSHGGLYTTHGADEQVFLKDVQLWSGYYDGQFDMSLIEAGGQGSNCYFGFGWYMYSDGSSLPGGDSYLDGCVFEGKNGASAAFCVRDVKPEETSTNRLFISNSQFVNQSSYRVRGNSDSIPAELYIGTGCNFTASQKTDEGPLAIVEETNGLYRKHYPGEELNGADFAALVDYMNAKTAGV